MPGESSSSGRDRHLGQAWLLLTAAVALHVADEAANDFLGSFYNPTVISLRDRLGWFPAPTFTFEGWLAGLITGIVLLLLLTPFAYRRARWVVGLAWIYGGVMILNALGHTAISLAWGRAVAGVYSSPFLLAAAGYLLWAVAQRRSAS
jgi:hypothetical protein